MYFGVIGSLRSNYAFLRAQLVDTAPPGSSRSSKYSVTRGAGMTLQTFRFHCPSIFKELYGQVFYSLLVTWAFSMENAVALCSRQNCVLGMFTEHLTK